MMFWLTEKAVYIQVKKPLQTVEWRFIYQYIMSSDKALTQIATKNLPASLCVSAETAVNTPYLSPQDLTSK